MKMIIYAILFAQFFSSCAIHRELLEQGKSFENFRGFVPVDPIEYDNDVQLSEGGKILNKEIKLLSSDETLQFLNNETVLVSIGQINAEGNISYTPITISAKHTSYKVTMDYMKFATLAQIDDEGKFIGFNRVGVGLRLITLVTTSEAGINIGDLSSIGLAVKAGQAKGTLMIEVVGIKSKEVTTLLPLPSEINQTTIQNAMQALATIKSKIYDTDTKLYPQVMAIKPDSSISKKNRQIVKDSTKTIAPKIETIDNDIRLQIGNNKASSAGKFQSAQDLESQAFDLLFNKKIDEAIAKFEECEKTYSGFHSVSEIATLLKSEKPNLLNPNSTKWKQLFSHILKSYSWRLPDDILQRLKAESA